MGLGSMLQQGCKGKSMIQGQPKLGLRIMYMDRFHAETANGVGWSSQVPSSDT